MIDRPTIDKILDAANIVDVVSDFVTLKRAGANYKGLCPFHDDRTPSFMVSPAKNFCKCFACGKGGNPVSFIMEHEQLTYPDALRWLAKKYGITIQERELSAEEKANQTERESLFIANDWANQWFQDQMYNTPDGKAIGLAYFRGRGFRDDIIRKFQLGYCPSGRDKCTQAALKAGYKEQYLISTPDAQGIAHGVGISIKHEDGKIFDRFSGRVMFPIFTISGKVVGFGGRVLDSATKGVNVKYQNSPESIIYHKKSELYGLFQAKQAIVKQDCCFMVEGYTDVLAMHQNGVENVVASSGTALTHEQIRLLHRFTSNIVVLYDGDAAGIKASQRGIDMLLREGMNVKLMLLPDGKDPDEFGREHTAQEFQAYMQDNQVDFIKFKTNLLLEEAKGDPIKLSRLVSSIVQSISVIPDEITRVFYIRETAQMMQMREALITDAVSKQVQLNIEEWRKEREREARRPATSATATTAASPGASSAPVAPAATVPTTATTPAAFPAGTPAGPPTLPDDGMPPVFLPDEEMPTATATAAATVPAAATMPTAFPAGLPSPLQAKEYLLAQAIIRHGEVLICNLTDEDGNEQPLSVAQYIDYALSQDGLQFQNPAYRSILQEANQHILDPDFVAERYFLNHPDQALSSLAFELSSDKEELSKLYDQTDSRRNAQEVTNQLMDQVNHLIVDLKLCIITEQRKQLQQQMRDPALLRDKEALRQLMTDFQRIKAIENSLARACGDRVYTH